MREIVLDTNVLVAGLRSKRGASYQLLRSIVTGKCRLNISVALALEYEDVLSRENLVPGWSRTDVNDFLGYLFRISNLFLFVLRQRPILSDPDYEHILELAIQSRALIVTHNKRDFMGAERFGVNVNTPAEFLQTLRGEP